MLAVLRKPTSNLVIVNSNYANCKLCDDDGPRGVGSIRLERAQERDRISVLSVNIPRTIAAENNFWLFLISQVTTRIFEKSGNATERNMTSSTLRSGGKESSIPRSGGVRTTLRTIKTFSPGEEVHTLLRECPYNLPGNSRRAHNPTKHFRLCASDPAPARQNLCFFAPHKAPGAGRGDTWTPEHMVTALYEDCLCFVENITLHTPSPSHPSLMYDAG
ncbi:hypothetical protein J6590_022544 [Homalodisca vitripennis]|nr:hypothetical protein J6590_022544 [Homalodisca vitripennis]